MNSEANESRIALCLDPITPVTHTCLSVEQEGFIKERVPEATWEVFLEKYEKADEEQKHKPELKEAMTLRVENVRVPLPTAIQRNRNMNPPPVSTTFATFDMNDTIWDAMSDGLKPRIEELLDGYALLCRPKQRT